MATYWVKSGTGGTDAGTSWANAAESIAGLIAAQAVAGGDIIYVHNTHANNAGTSITWSLPETGAGLVQVLCVDGGDATGASLVDGTVGNLTTGAVESTNSNSSFTFATNSNKDAALFIHGLTIKAGTGGNEGGADISIHGSAGKLTMSACEIWVNSTSTGAITTIGANASLPICEFINCSFRYAATGQFINLSSGYFKFINCKINGSGSSPTTLFKPQDRSIVLECSSCDWSLVTNMVDVSLGQTKTVMNNCAINTPTTGTFGGYGCGYSEFMACAPADGSNGADILNYYYQDAAGTVQDSVAVYKATSGAQGEQDDGTDTSYSLQMDPSTKCSPVFPLYTPWIYTLVGSTGSKTVALKVAHTESAVLTDVDIFMEVEYMGEPGLTGTQRVANSPMSVMEIDDDSPFVATTLARDILAASAANRADDALDDWTGLTGELEHTLTATVTCDEVGYIRCRVGLTKDTTNAVYVDPKISVT